MSGSKPQRLVAIYAAVVIAALAASARAEDLPGSYRGHNVSFSYPVTWWHVPASYRVQIGTPLWSEFFAPPPYVPPPPPPPPPTDPNQPAPPSPPAQEPAPPPTADQFTDIVGISAYRLSLPITKTNLPRYKRLIQTTVLQLALRSGGQMLSAGKRVTTGGLPGYSFDVTLPSTDGKTLHNHIVMVFKQRLEYFVNCQYLVDGPLAAEVTAGCTQLTKSFRSFSK
jgi:hypothetical protein